MGARQSRRSVDITTTPKKEGLPAEGVVGDAAAPGDGKLEKIEEADAKPTTNGVAPHTDATSEDKDKDKDEATEKEKDKDDAAKVDEPKVESPTTETPAEGAAEVTTPTEGTPASPTSATSPESKETKKKDKPKKKWSFRSISFGKKDKNKPVREDTPKNGDVAKETLAEGGEEAETAAAASSPADDKSAVSSPTEKEQTETVAVEAPAVATEAKAVNDDKSTSAADVVPAAATAVATSPIEEKKDESSSPASNPVPVEANKVEEIVKDVKPANVEKIVEVSPVQAVIEAPVEVNSQSKQIATTATTTAPSIIERKTSEDFPSQYPSSPPPTPIDPSPLQQAQQVAANASAIAEALKLPAEAANKANIANASVKPASATIVPTSPASSWRVQTNSTTLATEQPSKFPSSEHPEHTGNASPIPVTFTATNVATVTDTTQKPSPESPKSDVEVTKVVLASDAAESEILMAIPAVDIASEEIEAKNEVVEVMVEEEISKSLSSNENPKSLENDLVIQTEEGPMPVSGEIVVEAKPALVVPDSPAKDEIEIFQVSMELEESRESEKESALEYVESMDGSLIADKEESDVSQMFDESILSAEMTNDEDNSEKDLPPPLPASSVPVPKSTNQLLNFMSTQIEDSPINVDVIESPNNNAWSPEINSSPLAPRLPEVDAEFEFAEESSSQDQEQTDTSCSLPPPEEIVESRLNQLVELAEDKDLPPAPHQLPDEDISCQSPDNNARDMENTINSEISEVTEVSPAPSVPHIPTDATLLTPPRSPSPAAATLVETDVATRVSSHHELSDDPINLEFKTESVEDSLNSYNDSELELQERLAETLEENTIISCQLSNDIPKNDQSKVEASVENNVIANDIGTMETNDDAPKSPPPAIPAEVPAPTLGPAITEDVASVTKAIEEIDINEKAVAAAVNENIESVNTNEIITDMNHQNNMNE